MKFTKYHGLGNDFVVVDLRGGGPDADLWQRPDHVERVCSRRFGVGADGVLAILAPRSPDAAAAMRVLNADGSEAEMCGNGLRCVVKHLLETAEFSAADRLTIDTGAGPLTCAAAREHGAVRTVSVEMGRPRFSRSEIPMTGPADERVVAHDVDGLSFTAVSMGNPHAVHFAEPGEPLRDLAQRLGPRYETHEAFPARTNVEFARVREMSPVEIDLVVWERGSGLTLACGTGACATVVAGILEGRVPAGEPVTVHLPGGALEITVDAELSRVTMTGPAERVFAAELA